MRELQGILTAIITPLDETGQLDTGRLGPFLHFQQQAGIDGVVVAGTNGEGPSLSVEERIQLLDAVLATRAHLPGSFTVAAATGAAALPDAIRLTRHACAEGADAVLVLPPFFFKDPEPAGVAAYFREIMDHSTVPVLLYSIPQISSIPITDELLDRLSDHPRLAGVKDSSGDWSRSRALLQSRPSLKIFPGSDRLLARALAAGAPGSISGTANPFPEVVTAVRDAFNAGRDGLPEQNRLDRLMDILLDYPRFSVNKAVLAHRGLPRTWARPPLVNLSPAQEASLLSRLQDAGFNLTP